jgi:hypothetical protein
MHRLTSERAPPLEDPSVTHGLCQRHLADLLATIPSRSLSTIQLLIVVPAQDRSLYEYLKRVMTEVGGVQVIVDRRHGERRHASRSISDERRQMSRRRASGITSAMGCTFVRLSPRPRPAIKRA